MEKIRHFQLFTYLIIRLLVAGIILTKSISIRILQFHNLKNIEDCLFIYFQKKNQSICVEIVDGNDVMLFFFKIIPKVKSGFNLLESNHYYFDNNTNLLCLLPILIMRKSLSFWPTKMEENLITIWKAEMIKGPNNRIPNINELITNTEKSIENIKYQIDFKFKK